mgnify:CR=1 FL=1
MTTLGTLVGLLGTVMGMIKSFQALSQSGAPDSTELSTGISEALINTAFGVFHQSAVDNGSNGTFLFGAEGTSSGDVVTKACHQAYQGS